jgi:hypothetical protein
MNERVSIPLPADLAAWLKREAERLERPVAFVARKAIEAARREAQTAAATPCREYPDAPAACPGTVVRSQGCFRADRKNLRLKRVAIRCRNRYILKIVK